MLHLKQSTTAQTVRIPRPQVMPQSGEWVFTLRNGITKKEYTFSGAPTFDGLVLNKSITFEALPDKGQYTYKLKRGDMVVSSGLAQIGQDEMQPTRTTYNETITTIQFNG